MEYTKITREQSKDFTIGMWEELALTGSDNKRETKAFLEARKLGNYKVGSCFLCTYDAQEQRDASENDRKGECHYCPSFQLTRASCTTTAYSEWANADTKEERKKYAQQFLDEVLLKMK